MLRTGRDLVQRAKEDLADRLGLEPAEITLVIVAADEFPAGDLGCPASKEVLPVAPAFVTGQIIILAAHNRQFLYHTHAGQLAFCGER